MDNRIIPFPEKKDELPDVAELSQSQLKAWLENLRRELADLDRREPRDESSEEYADWADEHEELEDLVDEVLDRMEELTEE